MAWYKFIQVNSVSISTYNTVFRLLSFSSFVLSSLLFFQCFVLDYLLCLLQNVDLYVFIHV